jgi:hypothetical protein
VSGLQPDQHQRATLARSRGPHVVSDEASLNVDPDSGIGRVTSVAILIGALAAIVAGATIWLLLTDPVAVLDAVDEGQVSPLVRQLANIIYNALSGLLDYL